MLEQTVVHLIRQHVDATTFSASLIHTPTMQELASVRRFLDGLCSGTNDDSASAAPLLRLIRRVDISPGSVSILLDRNAFAACLSMGPERIRKDALRILAPFRLRRRGVETKLVLGNPTKSVDRTLLRNIANALSWLDRIKAGKTYEEIATENAIPTDRVRKAIRYAFLAPDIVRAIVEGRQPVGLTSSYLLHHPLPDDWVPWCITLDNSKGISRLRFWAKNSRVNGINDLPVFVHQGNLGAFSTTTTCRVDCRRRR